jgi:hypothetical protein
MLAKYEHDTHIVFIPISYSVLRVRIVFVVYCIHIFAPEYEHILNIFKYILATETKCSIVLKLGPDVCVKRMP